MKIFATEAPIKCLYERIAAPRSKDSKFPKIFLIIACLFSLTSCGFVDADEKTDFTAPVSGLQTYFEEAYPDKEIILLFEGDCNADGITDLVVVYRENENANSQVTVYSHEGGYKLSSPISAPFEDVALKWKDIDERPPVELIVSGRRGIYFGIGVFRFVDGEWIDLFGGMEMCC